MIAGPAPPPSPSPLPFPDMTRLLTSFTLLAVTSGPQRRPAALHLRRYRQRLWGRRHALRAPSGPPRPTGGFWNDLDLDFVAGPVLVSPPLNDIGSSPTAVTLTWDGLGADPLPLFFDEPCTTTLDDAALIDDCGYIGGSSQFRFDGLPGGTYTVLHLRDGPGQRGVPDQRQRPRLSRIPAQDVGGDFCLRLSGRGITHARAHGDRGRGPAAGDRRQRHRLVRQPERHPDLPGLRARASGRATAGRR